MTFFKEYSGVVALVILAILNIAPLFMGHSLGQSGTRFPNGLAVGTTATVTQNKITIGNSGTAIGNALFGTCTLAQSSAGSHAASTSKEFLCSASGVTASDNVIVLLPPGAGIRSSGASSPFGGFVVNSAFATTSDVIGVTIANNTGAATSSYTQATTSALWFSLR